MLRCFSLNSHPVIHAQVGKNMQKRSQLLIHTNSMVPSYQKEEPFTNLFPLFSQTCQVSPSLNPSCHMQTSMTNLICSQPRSRSTCANFAKIRFGSFVRNSLLEQREVPNLLRECRSTWMVRAIHIPDV